MLFPRLVFEKPVKTGYTVGVRLRFLPFYRKYQVNAHSWENFRFILNLVSGEQIQIPGFQVPSFKVYSDFWEHQKNKQLSSTPRPVVKLEGASARQDPVPPTLREKMRDPAEVAPPVIHQMPEEPALHDHVSPEVKRRASERLRGIFTGTDLAGQVGHGSHTGTDV